jgi:hypothetical protein
VTNDDNMIVNQEQNKMTRSISVPGLVSKLTGRHIIRWADETTLVGVVMTLTGGSANPEVVRHHINRVKAEAKR